MTNGYGSESPANKIATAQATLGLVLRLNGAEFKDGIFNIVLNALSASALTVDETLHEVFDKVSTDTDPTRVGIRVMVKQLRNAFAHNPWRPKWVIHEKYKKSYPIELDDGSKFTFNATNLNGDDLKPEHVGGLEFWTKLLQYCERLCGSIVI